MLEPTQRFSSRVQDYVLYRPGYPRQVLEVLRTRCGLRPDWTVADLGSGTGLLSRLFLENGNAVLGIEPNLAMREAGESLLRGQPQFRSVEGTAEATALPPGSIDLASAGQAFHWFDRERTRLELQRILRPDGWLALIWNERRPDSTPFLRAYEQLLRTWAPEYERVGHQNLDDGQILGYFARDARLDVLPNEQRFGFEGLRGRLMSSSYAPEAGDPGHEPMLSELRRIFDEHRSGAQIAFEYETKVFSGRVG